MGLTGRKCKERDSCVAACINTLMDRDDCPHFFNSDAQHAVEAWSALRMWMRGHGKDLFLAPWHEDPRPLMVGCANSAPYILLHFNGVDDHAVICRDGEKVFDPAWIGKPIVGPMTCGYWMVGVVVDYHP